MAGQRVMFASRLHCPGHGSILAWSREGHWEQSRDVYHVSLSLVLESSFIVSIHLTAPAMSNIGM
jgi:hypothetical protein